MSIAELTRFIESKHRSQKEELQKQASMDYILADLIGRSISRVYNSSNKMPMLEEAYPNLFDEQVMLEQRANKQAEVSALRFKMFANSFNNRFKEGGNSLNE